LLDVSTFAAEVFLTLQLISYVRATLDHVYTACQAQGLTIRTVQILLLLTQVDILTRDLSESQIKISNLNTMLGLPDLENGKVSIISHKNRTKPMHSALGALLSERLRR